MTTRTRTRASAPAAAPAAAAPAGRTRGRAPATAKKDADTGPVDPRAGLDALMGEIIKRDGENAVLGGTTGRLLPSLNFIPTNNFALDYALLGGIPEGAVSTVLGREGAGKTSLIMDIIASAQRKHRDKRAVVVDPELTFDMDWAMKKGCSLEDLFYLQPDSGEKGVDYINSIMHTGGCSLLVVDSIPALVPQKVAAAAAEDALPAVQARLISRMCSVILDGIRKCKDINPDGFAPAVVLVNRFGAKMGGAGPAFMGEPKEELGGKQVRYLATTKIEVAKKEEHVAKDETGADFIDYNVHTFKILKTKIGNSAKNGEYVMNRTSQHAFLNPGEIDDAQTVLTYAKRLGWVHGATGNWRIDGVDDRKFRGLEHMVEFLYLNPDFFIWLKRRIILDRRARDNGKTLPPDGYLCGPGGIEVPAYA